jgi:hypothetical protein
VDRLRGLKENVIIGKLIPAGTGARRRPELGDLTLVDEGTNIDEYLRTRDVLADDASLAAILGNVTSDADDAGPAAVSLETIAANPELAFAELLAQPAYSTATGVLPLEGDRAGDTLAADVYLIPNAADLNGAADDAAADETDEA